MKKIMFDRALEVFNINEQVVEYNNCSDNPVYFINKHVKHVNFTGYLESIKLYEYQERLIQAYYDNKFNIVKGARQVGLSLSNAVFALQQALFNDNNTVIIAGNLHAEALAFLKQINIFYNYLPDIYKQQCNLTLKHKHQLSFSNGSNIIAMPAVEHAIRGRSIDLLIMDNFAHSPSHKQEDFFFTVLPALCKKGKAIITCTPASNYMLFNEIFQDALDNKNDFVAHSIKWNLVPGRDNKFEEKTIGNRNGNVEYKCSTMIKENHHGTRKEQQPKET